MKEDKILQLINLIKFDRINLIVGKNRVGKSSMLKTILECMSPRDCIFVGKVSIREKKLAEMFDPIVLKHGKQYIIRIILKDTKQYVIEALRIIEPKIEDVEFIMTGYPPQPCGLVKFTDEDIWVWLNNMGDGINCIFNIVFAAINFKVLLIDEFENSLHYTVQEELWKLIFKLSKTFNIQVFATTHSNDCISAFERALNSDGNTVTGKLIRLENVNGSIKYVEYSGDELKIINEQHIETR
jgi:ABC-type dipeptide/oligopeptide/nickel transport system ATPase component